MGRLAAPIKLLSASSLGRWPLFAKRAKRKMSLFRIQLSTLITWPETGCQNMWCPFFGFKHVWFKGKRAPYFETSHLGVFSWLVLVCPSPYQLQWYSSISDTEIRSTGYPTRRKGFSTAPGIVKEHLNSLHDVPQGRPKTLQAGHSPVLGYVFIPIQDCLLALFVKIIHVINILYDHVSSWIRS